MKDTDKHLAFFINHIPKALQYYDQREVNSVQLFALGLLKRLNHASNSLMLILENIEQKPQLDFSAGITIRAILLDTLLGLNFYKLLKDNLPKKLPDEQIKLLTTEFCDIILADGLENTVKYFELARTLGFISNIEHKQLLNNFITNYSTYFEPHLNNGQMPRVKFERVKGPIELFKVIAGDSDMKNISRIYDLYLFYSKYDHFGILYFNVKDAPLHEKIDRLERSVYVFVRHCANLYDILERVSQKDKFIKKQYNIANNYLNQNNGT